MPRTVPRSLQCLEFGVVCNSKFGLAIAVTARALGIVTQASAVGTLLKQLATGTTFMRPERTNKVVEGVEILSGTVRPKRAL
jgi:hypothetical protein